MLVETIQMDPRIARIKYADYMKAVRRHRTERERQRIARAAESGKELRHTQVEKSQLEREDEMLKKAYRQLARGSRILDLDKVVSTAGLYKETRLPKLAIARANAQRCRLTSTSNGIRFASDGGWQKKDRVEVRLPNGDGSAFSQLRNWEWRRANNFPNLSDVEALVPSIPPEYRPDNPGEYHILWEAEWAKAAPVDPILLKHIGDRLYVVVAQWDLTPLEQSVLEGRLG